jgi:hypothetical protein
MECVLCILTFTTKLGASYMFPDVPSNVAEAFLRELAVAGDINLTLTNVSCAVLCIPFRILSTVSVNGEERWRCPA